MQSLQVNVLLYSFNWFREASSLTKGSVIGGGALLVALEIIGATTFWFLGGGGAIPFAMPGLIGTIGFSSLSILSIIGGVMIALLIAFCLLSACSKKSSLVKDNKNSGILKRSDLPHTEIKMGAEGASSIPTEGDGGRGEERVLKPVYSTYEDTKQETIDATQTVNIRAQLPKYVFSALGSLSIGNFHYYLGQENPANKKEIILWSFQQRKFLTEGGGSDTVGGGKRMFLLCHGKEATPYAIRSLPCDNSLYALVDEKGNATSSSAHSPETGIFIKDDVIEKVEACVRYEIRSFLYIGYYEDGKCIIQQPGVRACVYTCAAMVLIDKKVDFDLGILFYTNLADDKQLNNLLKRYDYKLSDTIPLDIPSLQRAIEQHGSLLVGVSGSIGSHEIVVDAINDFTVTIRDPFHGWRITMGTQEFFKMHPVFKATVKIT